MTRHDPLAGLCQGAEDVGIKIAVVKECERACAGVHTQAFPGT
jgi:hypothetical protein